MLVMAATEDTVGLVGQELTLERVGELGYEHYQDSLIVGETAYQCEEGFLGTLEGGPAQAAAPAAVPAAAPVAAPAAKAESSKDQTESDADLLTDFLLKHL